MFTVGAPEDIVTPVPTELADQNRLLVTVVYAADTICCQSKHGFNLTALNQKLDEAGLADIGDGGMRLDEDVAEAAEGLGVRSHDLHVEQGVPWRPNRHVREHGPDRKEDVVEPVEDEG